MLRRMLLVLLVAAIASPLFAAKDVRSCLSKWHAGKRIDVILVNGGKMTGHLGKVEADQFVLEPDGCCGAARVLRYGEVQTVRNKMTRTRKWVIGVAVYLGVVAMGAIVGD